MWDVALGCMMIGVIISMIIYMKAKRKGVGKVTEFKGKITELREDKI